MREQHDLKAWHHIHELKVWEAACLISGIDPARKNLPDDLLAFPTTYERAMREAIERAEFHAWQTFDDKEISDSPKTSNIWAETGAPEDFLITNELDFSIREILYDPQNSKILEATDTYYSATIGVERLNEWLALNNIKSAFAFHGKTFIRVIAMHENSSFMEAEINADLSDAELVEKRAKQGRRIERLLNERLGATGEKTPPPVIDSATRPIGTKERNTLLATIGVLCRISGIDPQTHAKSAGKIIQAAALQGVSLGETTIEGHLKRVSEALAARSK